jgi:hypothetical protein
MRTHENTKPTLIEIINYWHDQKKKNTGRLNMQLYMKVCEAKAYSVRWNEDNKTWTRI